MDENSKVLSKADLQQVMKQKKAHGCPVRFLAGISRRSLSF